MKDLSMTKSDIEKAVFDSICYGEGVLKDGKHIPYEEFMSKKTFADICLERAEKATTLDWVETGRNGENSFGYFKPNNEFIAHARTDVPELARRLKKACDALRRQVGQYDIPLFAHLLKELEAPLEGDEK